MERHHWKIRPQVGLLAIGLVAAASWARAETYQIRPAPDTNFTLKVYKTGLLSGKVHVFVFERYQGEWEYVEGKPQDWRVELTIESDSLVLTDDWISEKDFPKVIKEARVKMLDVEKHPTMTFRSRSVTTLGANRYSLQGDLTIRGIAKPSTVEIAVSDQGEALRMEGASEVRLTDYGLKPPSAFFGAVGTKSEMDAQFTLRAEPKATQ